jgi:hypothetical protein
MAKGKLSSPKKSRRGGRRSPKKSKKGGVHKTINKDVAEPMAHALEIQEAEDVQGEQPEAPENPDLVSSAKEMLTHFVVSLNEDVLASAWSLSQLPDHEFIFGKVASMLAANGHFGEEVETNLSAVWKADEAWTRSLLAGEVKPPEPEPEAIEEPAAAEPEAVIEPEAVMDAVMEPEAVMEAEAPAQNAEVGMVETAENKTEEMNVTEVAAKSPLLIQEPQVVQEPPFVQEPAVVHYPAIQEPAVFEDPTMQVPDKENATIADAGTMPFAKQLGEPPAMHVSAVEGLAAKDVNVQPMPMDLA